MSIIAPDNAISKAQCATLLRYYANVVCYAPPHLHQTKKSDEHRVTGSSDFFFCHPKSPFDTNFDTNIICSGTTLDIILFLAVDYAERTIPFFLRTARAIALTNSTIGIMEKAVAILPISVSIPVATTIALPLP